MINVNALKAALVFMSRTTLKPEEINTYNQVQAHFHSLITKSEEPVEEVVDPDNDGVAE